MRLNLLSEADLDLRTSQRDSATPRYIRQLMRIGKITHDDVIVAAAAQHSAAIQYLQESEEDIPDLQSHLDLDTKMNLLVHGIYLVKLPPEIVRGLPKRPWELLMGDGDYMDALQGAVESAYEANWTGEEGRGMEGNYFYSVADDFGYVPPAIQVLNVIQWMSVFPDENGEDSGAPDTGLNNLRLALGDNQFYSFIRQQLLPPELH